MPSLVTQVGYAGMPTMLAARTLQIAWHALLLAAFVSESGLEAQSMPPAGLPAVVTG